MPGSRPDRSPRGGRSARGWLTALVAALAVTAGALFVARSLSLRSEIVDLLPDRPASRDYREFLELFGGLDKLYVLVEAEDPAEDDAAAFERVAAAAVELAERLESTEAVREARAGFTDDDEEFLLEHVLPRAFLLVDDDTVADLARRLDTGSLDARLAGLRRDLAAPAGVGAPEWLAADPLGFAEALDVGAGSAGNLRVDPVEGVFVGRDDRSALVVATPAVSELDSASGEALEELLAGLTTAVSDELGGGLRFRALGGPLYAARDARRVRADLMRTLASSGVAVAVLLLFYFRRSWLPLAILAGVLAGVVWAAAAARVAMGSLGVLAISFSAILIGLGVDYGIHAAHLFDRERRRGHSPPRAMIRALSRARPAIVASVATTAAAFAVLGGSTFHPLRELGALVAIGIVAILAASLAVGAPLAVLVARRSVSSAVAGRLGQWIGDLARGCHRRRVSVLVLAAIATGASVWALPALTLDTDLRKLRPRDDPTRALEVALLERFDLGLDGFHVFVRGADVDEALSRAAAADRLLRERLAADGVVVWSPSRFAAGRTTLERRSELFRKAAGAGARQRLESALDRAGLRAEGMRLAPLLTVLGGGTPPALDRDRWPSWLDEVVRRVDGGFAVALRVTAPVGTWPDGPPAPLREELLAAVPETSVVSVPGLGTELHATIAEELRRLGGVCLLAVILVVTVSFRGDVGRTVLGLIPVSIGCVWLLGLFAALGIPVGIFAVAAAPLVLGIGIDDGLHALHGARLDGGLVPALRRIGPAMVLTSATTCSGFFSLGLNGIPAVRNGGLMVCIGVALCLLATLVVLPALAPRPRGNGSGDPP